MTTRPIIEVRNVHIKYRGVTPMGYRSLLRRIFRRETSEQREAGRFTAVRDVSFDVYPGEVVGIIGENGSGKSTLLRALANIYSPDSGTITIHTERYSLLALGVGFQSRLTGYENIFLSGYALGFSKEEVEAVVDEIIRFSELGDFINRPVKTYSSGMYSKLAFSISTTLATEVLFIDEVLSVGDIRFGKKSRARIRELINDEERSVVLVSHSLNELRDLCDKVLWLHKGEQIAYGDATELLDQYEKYMLEGDGEPPRVVVASE